MKKCYYEKSELIALHGGLTIGILVRDFLTLGTLWLLFRFPNFWHFFGIMFITSIGWAHYKGKYRVYFYNIYTFMEWGGEMHRDLFATVFSTEEVNAFYEMDLSRVPFNCFILPGSEYEPATFKDFL